MGTSACSKPLCLQFSNAAYLHWKQGLLRWFSWYPCIAIKGYKLFKRDWVRSKRKEDLHFILKIFKSAQNSKGMNMMPLLRIVRTPRLVFTKTLISLTFIGRQTQPFFQDIAILFLLQKVEHGTWRSHSLSLILANNKSWLFGRNWNFWQVPQSAVIMPTINNFLLQLKLTVSPEPHQG